MGSAGKAVGDLASGNIGGFFGSLFGEKPEAPAIPELPAPVEEVDLAASKSYRKAKLKGRKGRRSTILSQMGDNNADKKTALG